jgi:hypothetical protein
LFVHLFSKFKELKTTWKIHKTYLKSKSEQYDCSLNSGAPNESSRNNNNIKNGHEIDSDRFINYIKSILKRDLTIPVIKFVIIKLVLLFKKLILILKKWQ